MNKISIFLVSALMIVSGIIGAGVGYALTPEYSQSMYDKPAMELGVADRKFDLRYINAMIAHHRGAMLVAKQAEKSQRIEVKELAKSILENEPVAIAELYKWKKDWYGDERKVKDPQVPNLGEYDDKFDLRFLNAVISHHQNGVTMTSETKIKTSRTEVLNNADGVETFLLKGIDMLKDWRKSWYNI